MVQTETGEHHGENCCWWKHVSSGQSQNSLLTWETLQGVWGRRSPGEQMTTVGSGGAAAANRWAPLGRPPQSQSDLSIKLTTVFSFRWAWCARSPLHVYGGGEENHLCCETNLHPQTRGGGFWNFSWWYFQMFVCCAPNRWITGRFAWPLSTDWETF